MEKGLENMFELYRNVFDVYLFCVSSSKSSLQNQKLANKIFQKENTKIVKTGAVCKFSSVLNKLISFAITTKIEYQLNIVKQNVRSLHRESILVREITW